MGKFLEIVGARAKANPKRIAFPEATNEGICKPVLLGVPNEIRAVAKRFNVSLNGMEIIDAFNEEWLNQLIEKYVAEKPFNTVKTMKRKVKDPLYTALMLEDIGGVDCTLGGFTHTTGEFMLAAQEVIGLKPGFSTISSMCVLEVPGFEGSEGELLAFGDCVVFANPNEEELANIAIGACDSMKVLLGWEPRCALLSYSTVGSGSGPLVDKVVNAVKIANQCRPDLAIDGEFQFDSAVIPQVAAKKVKRESRVAGKANIIIAPDLNVGNIGVKMVQNFCRADAYGLILVGLAKPVNDMSRSAPVSELVGNIAIACVSAQGVM